MPKSRPPRRKPGTGKIQYDKSRKTFVARTTDGSRSGRFTTRQAAEKALDAWNAAADMDMDLKGGRQTMQYFLSAWLEDVAKTRVSSGTYQFYLRHLNYAIPYIGDTTVEGLTSQQIQRMLNALSGDLAPRSVKHVHSVLRNAMKTALHWKLRVDNPVLAATPPRAHAYAAYAMQPDEVVALLHAAEGHRLSLVVHLALLLGLRRGEILALRWPDYDRTRQTVTIRESKTDAGRRTLPLTSDLCQRLDQHWQHQQEERALLGTRWQEHGLIVASEVGTPIAPRNIIRWFKSLLKRAGLPESIRIHDLRHTAITDWIEAGANPKTAQALAGHNTAAITMDIYAHARSEPLRQAIEATEARRKQA